MRFDDIEKDRSDREAEAIKQREMDDAARAKRDAEAKAAEDAAVAQHAADAAKAEKKAEMQRDMGIDVDPNAVLEPPIDLEKQAEKEAPTEVITTDTQQPFVWHGSETVGSSDVVADDGISSYTPPAAEVDPEAAMMTSNADAREQAIAAAEAAATRVKEAAMGVAAANVAGGAATQDPSPARVSEAVAPQGQAPAPVAEPIPAPNAEATAAASAAREAAIAAQDAAAAKVTQEGLNPGAAATAAAQEGSSWAVQNAQEMRDRAMADEEAANRRNRLEVKRNYDS